jgi:hypothetical protein
MLVIYNGATVCAYQQPFNCELRLQPHIKEVSECIIIQIDPHYYFKF